MTRIPTLSLRRHLVAGLGDFLAEAELPCAPTADALAELVVSLSHYREEGTALFPMVFLGNSVEELLGAVGGADPIPLGRGPADAATIRLALKRSAPLCVGRHWSIYVSRERAGCGPSASPRSFVEDGGRATTDAAAFAFGVFRADPFPLQPTPIERLSALPGRVPVFGVIQRAPDLVEIRSSGGLVRHVLLAGSDGDEQSPTRAIDAIARCASRDVAPEFSAATHGFYRRGLVSVLQSGHGSLVGVTEANSSLSRLFADGVIHQPPVPVAEAIRAACMDPNRDVATRVRAYGHLFEGMLGMDGVTLISSAGDIVGYHIFLRNLEDGPPSSRDGEAASSPVGGARRRTYAALASWVGRGLVGAFYRSQDGGVAFRVAESPEGASRARVPLREEPEDAARL